MNGFGYFMGTIITTIATVIGFIMGACAIAFVYEREENEKLTKDDKEE